MPVLIAGLLLIAYIVGRVHSNRKKRKQCLNCGGYNTYQFCSGTGHNDTKKCEGVVWDFEGYLCNDCDTVFYAAFKLHGEE